MTYVLGTAVACAIVEGIAAARFPKQLNASEGLGWTDLAIVGVLWGCCSWWLVGLTAAFNPNWVAYGQDYYEFLAQALHHLDPGLGKVSGYRYPLFTWLSAGFSALSEMPIWRATMVVAVLGQALMVPATYLLGRLALPRPVAVAGAILPLHTTNFLEHLGMPWEYPFTTALLLLCVALGIEAIRRGGPGRAGLAGLACALHLSSTAKSLPFVLVLLSATALSSLCSRRGARAVGAELLALAAPIVVMWFICAPFQGSLYSLERAVLVNQVLDPNKPFPRVGWTPSDLAEKQGYWVFGRSSSLLHLHQTFWYLAAAPTVDSPSGRALDSFSKLAGSLGLGTDPRPLLLALVGILATAGWRFKRLSTWIALGAICLVVLGRLLVIIELGFIVRYAWPLLAAAPALLLAGGLSAFRAWPRRPAGREWLFLPVVAVAASLVFGPGPSGVDKALANAKARRAFRHPMHEVWALRDRLEPGDEIVDATRYDMAFVSFHRDERVHVVRARAVGPREPAQFRVGASQAPRRWIIAECAVARPVPKPDRTRMPLRWLEAHPERFELFRDCIYRDRQPELPIEITVASLELMELPGAPSQAPSAPPGSTAGAPATQP